MTTELDTRKGQDEAQQMKDLPQEVIPWTLSNVKIAT